VGIARGPNTRPVEWGGAGVVWSGVEWGGGGGGAEAWRTRGIGETGKAGTSGGGRSAHAGDGVRPFFFFFFTVLI